MAKENGEITENGLQGFKYFKLLSKLLSKLHGVACERDRAHNRTLHMDQYMSLLILSFFNPVSQTLAGIHRASELEKVQQKLGVGRVSIPSLSEAARVFDSELLKPILAELADKVPALSSSSSLSDINEIITLMDGTVLAALPQMDWALFQTDHNAFKAHVQFELLKGIPVDATITDANASEKDVLENSLQPGRVYVLDRGYAKYSLFQKVSNAGSHFVCRIKDNSVFQVVEERELSPKDLKAGIVRDAVVRLGAKDTAGELTEPVRIVEIACTPHRKAHKNGRGGPQQGDTILVATDLLDPPAEQIALTFKSRWQIEIFFRFFKHVLGCRHLISHCENGIRLQMYAAIIACMLIALWTERKPTRATYEMICYWFMGWANDEELMAHLAKLAKQDASRKPQ
jgi:hypothetical protein